MADDTAAGAVHDYGERRNARTFALTYNADKILPAAPTVTSDEPTTEQGRVFDGAVSAVTELAGGGSQVKIAVTVDPDDNVKPDTYKIRLHVASAVATPVDLTPQVKYTHVPPLFFCWLLALTALVIGLAAGALLRWLSDTGTKLHDALWRRDVLASSLKGTSPLPAALNRDIATLDLVLARGDATAAETRLGIIEPKLPALFGALEVLAKLRAELLHQRTMIAAMGASADVARRLTTVILLEETLLDAQLDAAWPEPGAKEAERTALATNVLGFTGFLNTYGDPATRAADSHFGAALDLYVQGNFGPAEAEWRQAAAAMDPAVPSPEQLPGVPVSSTSVTTWAARNAPMLIGVLTGLGLTIVGLLTIFKPDTMFLTDDVRDFLVLIAWGFGSALTGMTVTQLAGKATGAAGAS